MAKNRRSKDAKEKSEASDKNKKSISKERRSTGKDPKSSKHFKDRKLTDGQRSNFGESDVKMLQQKTLSEATWNRITETEENLHVVLDVRDDLLEQVLKECQERYMAIQTIKFHAHCVHRAFMDLFGTAFLARDPGPDAPWSKRVKSLESGPPPAHTGDTWATGTVGRAPPPPEGRYDQRGVGRANNVKIPVYELERKPPTPPVLEGFDESLVRRDEDVPLVSEPLAPPPSLIMLPEVEVTRTRSEEDEGEGEGEGEELQDRKRTRPFRKRPSQPSSAGDAPPAP